MTATALKEASVSGMPHLDEAGYAALRDQLRHLIAEQTRRRDKRLARQYDDPDRQYALRDQTEVRGADIAREFGIGSYRLSRMGTARMLAPRGVWLEWLDQAGFVVYDTSARTYVKNQPEKLVLDEDEFRRLQAELSELAVERRIDREQRINDDPYMHPKQKEHLLDGTLLDNTAMAELMGVGGDRVSKLRSNIHITDRWPSTTDVPVPDAAVRVVAGVAHTLTSKGVWLEWLEQNGYLQFDPDAERYVRTQPRSGRARGQRATVGRGYDFAGRDPRYTKGGKPGKRNGGTARKD